MRAVLFLMTLLFFVLPATAGHSTENEKFAVYYSDKAPVAKFKPYQLLVFDSSHHPPLQPLKEEGKTILGYVTLGEIDSANPSFASLKSHGLVLQENPNWKGSYYVDIRDPLWAKTMIEDTIPAVLRQGFDGIFLDTLDDPLDLEENDSTKYAGMTEAATHLVQAIRMHYPTIKIMMNRAYAILPAVASSIDMELGESVFADYNFDKKTYDKVDDEDYQDQLESLQDAKQANPQLKVYTLDYANPSDRKTIGEIYKIERENGFIPYVATVELDQVVDEPGSSP
jgi:uncharacterized protein (TIGR01370 family)